MSPNIVDSTRTAHRNSGNGSSDGIRVRHVLMLSAACLIAVPPAMAGEPSAKDLIQLAPVISNSDRAYESIAVSCSMKSEGSSLRFRAIYRAPDRHAMLISDGGDGTPLAFIADDKMLIYDPIQPAVLRFQNAASHLVLKRMGGLPDFKFASEMGGREKKADELTFDFRSICELPAVEERVVKDGDGRYRLFRTNSDEVTTVYSIDSSRKLPLTGLKVFDKDSPQAFLIFDRIEANIVLKDEEFRFPDLDRLAGKIKVKDMQAEGFGQVVNGVALIMRAMEARIGANHRGVRKSIRFAALQGIHWDQVRKNDRRFSSLMKEIVPPEPSGPRAFLEHPPLPPLPPEGPTQAASALR